MKDIEFEQRLNDAFDNHLPIPDKVNVLRTDLYDTIDINILIANKLNDELLVQDIELFYQQCKLHLQVVDSRHHIDGKTTPIKNTQLWQESVTWLMVYYEHIWEFAEENLAFNEMKQLGCLWLFKWVLSELVENPKVQQQTIDNYFKLWVYYSHIFDIGRRSLHKIAVMQGIKMANRKMITEHLPVWLNAEKNYFDDCWACQVDDIIRAYVFLGDYDKALEWATEILDGSVTCGEVPHVTNSLIAQAYFYTNQIDKAQALLKNKYKMVKGKGQFMRPIAEFMRLAILLGNIKRAKQIYQDNKYVFDECESLFKKMLFAIEASKLPIAEQVEMLTIAKQLARQFDERNGNDYYTSQLPMLYS